MPYGIFRELPGTRQFPARLLASILEQQAHRRIFSGSHEDMPRRLVRLSSRLDQMTSPPSHMRWLEKEE